MTMRDELADLLDGPIEAEVVVNAGGIYAREIGAATLKEKPDEYLQKDFAALMETMGLASGMKLESENKNVPTGLEN